MRSILLIASANLRRRARQSALAGLSIALAALLLAAALGILGGMHRPFEAMYNRLNASHILLLFDARNTDVEAVLEWAGRQPEVAGATDPAYFLPIEKSILFEGKKLELILHLTERSDCHLRQDKVEILQGSEQTHPDYGEIWIPQHLSNTHGIQVGDTLGIPVDNGLYPLVVSATVLDPHFSSALMNPTRAWVAPGALPLMQPVHALTNAGIGLCLRDAADIDPLWARFKSEIDYRGNSLTYLLFRSVFMTTYQIIGGVLLIFSLLALLGALLVTSSTVSSAIYKDYRLIGILKSQGFTPRNVLTVYLIQYALSGLVAIPLGLLGAHFAIQLMLDALAQSIGVVNAGFSMLLPYGIALMVILFLLMLSTWLTARKAGSIKPVEAIRSGAPQGDAGRFSVPGKSNSVPLPVLPLLGLSMLSANPRRSRNTFIALLFAVGFLVFAVNISHSFREMKERKAMWGFEEADLQVTRESALVLPLRHGQLLEMLEEEAAIEVVAPFGYYHLTVPETNGLPPRELNGKVYERRMEAIGLINLRGRNPVQPDEISLCIGTSEDYGKTVGDTIELLMEGRRKPFQITGVYQDVSNMGQGFRLPAVAVRAFNPLFDPDHYAVRLRAGTVPEEVKQELQTRYGETIGIEASIEDRRSVREVMANLSRFLSLLSLFFLGVLIITIMTDLVLSINEQRADIGILKTVGFTPRQLRIAFAWKFLLLILLSLIIAVPFAGWFSPVLMSGVTGFMGLEQFPYVFDTIGTMLIIPLVLILGILAAWLGSRGILRISPRVLMSP